MDDLQPRFLGLKCTHNAFRLELCYMPRWGSSQRSPDLTAVFDWAASQQKGREQGMGGEQKKKGGKEWKFLPTPYAQVYETGNRGGGSCMPTPSLKKIEKKFFSCKYNVKFWHFVNFSYIYFRAKMSSAQSWLSSCYAYGQTQEHLATLAQCRIFTTVIINFIYITSSNTGRFSKFFQCRNLLKICNKTVTKFPTTPQTRRYTTLWKTDVRKLVNQQDA